MAAVALSGCAAWPQRTDGTLPRAALFEHHAPALHDSDDGTQTRNGQTWPPKPSTTIVPQGASAASPGAAVRAPAVVGAGATSGAATTTPGAAGQDYRSKESTPRDEYAPRTSWSPNVTEPKPASGDSTAVAAPPAGAPVAQAPVAEVLAPMPYRRPYVAEANGGTIIRGQSPSYGANVLAPVYPAGPPPAAPAAPTYYPAGTGVNQTPTTTYQPTATGGTPAIPAAFGQSTPNSPLVVPNEPGYVDNPLDGKPLDMDVMLQETQTGRLMLGVGVNSDAGLVGNIVLDEQNFDLFRPSFKTADWVNGTAFRGGGQRLRLEALPGTQVQRYSASLQDPYFMDMPFSFGVSAFYFERDYTSWREKRAGGQLSLGYLFPDRPDLSLTGSIGAQNVIISNPQVPTPPELEEVVGSNALFTGRVQLA
ncbi:MAG: BamA/TamA family outer membrane protein, partial [Planctomycetia bacterium]|nr:BamA/TamA family outer membrane protein [Planctomycetia bacterium]